MNIYGARNGSIRESVEMISFFFVFVSFGSMKMKIFELFSENLIFDLFYLFTIFKIYVES